ncbi:MAG: chromate efflux transporter [Pseudomonadota bacterium]
MRTEADTRPSVAEFVRAFAKIGLLSFGGPAAQIAVMQRVVIDERNWIGERDFLAALSFCMLLPGPEAMQLATWLGWRMRGTLGGVVAGLLFVLPGAAVVLGLAVAYVHFGSVPEVATVFLGVKATVIAIVLSALIRLSRRTLAAPVLWCVAAATFVGMFAFALPFPLVIVLAALVGCFRPVASEAVPAHAQRRASVSGTVTTALLWLAVWWSPLLAVYAWHPSGVLWDVGRFFSQLAVLSFGGAYAVLSWLAQDAVLHHGWLTTAQMMDGLGLAETTPGPLILVTEFVGFLAGAQQGGTSLGVVAALVTLWATFAPCFLWIFVGAPWLGWLCAQPRLAGMLQTITAAVVGVMASLALWFALNALFGTVRVVNRGWFELLVPATATLNLTAVVLTALALALVFRLGWGTVRVLLTCGGVAWVFTLL